MIFFPTRGRPLHAKRFATQYGLMGCEVPVLMILDADNQGAYENIGIPRSWKVFINPDSRDLVKACNNAFAEYPEEDFYALMADDVVPETEKWDIKLLAACLPHYIAWGFDGIHKDGEFAATHPFIGGELVRALGWFMPPYTRRGSADVIWRDLAMDLGIGHFVGDVVTRHDHYHLNPNLYDLTYAQQPSHTEDEKLYLAYKSSSQYEEDLNRVRIKLNLN